MTKEQLIIGVEDAILDGSRFVKWWIVKWLLCQFGVSRIFLDLAVEQVL